MPGLLLKMQALGQTDLSRVNDQLSEMGANLEKANSYL